jgi:hypothetical protein
MSSAVIGRMSSSPSSTRIGIPARNDGVVGDRVDQLEARLARRGAPAGDQQQVGVVRRLERHRVFHRVAPRFFRNGCPP